MQHLLAVEGAQPLGDLLVDGSTVKVAEGETVLAAGLSVVSAVMARLMPDPDDAWEVDWLYKGIPLPT